MTTPSQQGATPTEAPRTLDAQHRYWKGGWWSPEFYAFAQTLERENADLARQLADLRPKFDEAHHDLSELRDLLEVDGSTLPQLAEAILALKRQLAEAREELRLRTKEGLTSVRLGKELLAARERERGLRKHLLDAACHIESAGDDNPDHWASDDARRAWVIQWANEVRALAASPSEAGKHPDTEPLLDLLARHLDELKNMRLKLVAKEDEGWEGTARRDVLMRETTAILDAARQKGSPS